MSNSGAETNPPPTQAAQVGDSGHADTAPKSGATPPRASRRVPRTRAGMAWVAACAAGVIAIALIIFMLQNTEPVQVTFLWMTATTSLALMLLIAAVSGVVVTLILGSARIIQLRHTIHRKPRGAPTPPPPRTIQPDNVNQEADMTDESQAEWAVAEWHGRMIVDSNGDKIGRLQDVYVDVETDEPQFATVKEGFIGHRHLTFVPLAGVQVGPDQLQVTVTKEQVRSAPDIELHGEELSQDDESMLYHHFQQNYTPPPSDSGRRLARR